jgi:uncharacterized repeat protein (TIGR03803 family)
MEHQGSILGPSWRFGCPALAVAITLVGAFLAKSAQAQTYSVLYTFTGPDGAYPLGNLVLDKQGNLYGTTHYGGANSTGTAFEVHPATGTESVLHSFTATPDGAYPSGNLVMDTLGNLYGTTYFGGVHSVYGGTVFEVTPAGVETLLYSFCAKTNCTDGESPEAGLAMDAKGHLYGTTFFGGGYTRACGNNPCGAVFRVSTGKTVTYTRLYSFTGKADGGQPGSPLIEDVKGNLYGATNGDSLGTVFKLSLNTSWHDSVLVSFLNVPPSNQSRGGLVMDAQGNLYGTTVFGGVGSCMSGCGTIFKVDTSGKETVLYSFLNAPDGANPWAGLVLDAQGNLYGTTLGGGDAACGAPFGCGTVFKLDATGQETVLYSFTGGTDGAFPYAGLVLDAQGNLYGTTSSGGLNSCKDGSGEVGCGVVFKVTP